MGAGSDENRPQADKNNKGVSGMDWNTGGKYDRPTNTGPGGERAAVW